MTDKIFLARKTACFNTPEGTLCFSSGESKILKEPPFLLDPVYADILESLSRPAGSEILKERLLKLGWDSSSFDSLIGLLENLEETGLIYDLQTEGYGGEVRSLNVSPYHYQLWPTKDRPELIQRSLKQWDIFHDETGLNPAFIVADDSETDSDRIFESMKSSGISGKRRICFLNRSSRNEFTELFPEFMGESLRFGLGTCVGSERELLGAYGANQNFLLLLTAGSPSAFTDDDIVPVFRTTASGEDGLYLLNEKLDPSIPVIYSRMDELVIETEEAGPEDYMKIFSADNLKEVDFSEAGAETLEAWFSGKLRINAVCHCYWGHPGMDCASYLVGNRHQIRADYSDSDKYGKMMENLITFRAPDNPVVGGKAFMGGHSILYPDPILPPFSPLGRNQDGLWGLILEKLHPNGRVFYPDMAVKHDPLPPRGGTREKAVSWNMSINDLLYLLISFLEQSLNMSGETEKRYVQLGSTVENFCLGPEHRTLELIRELAVKTVLGRRELLRNLLSEYESEPAWWAEDVKASIQWLDELLLSPSFWIPEVYRENNSAFIEYFRNFGSFLAGWPEIYRRAKSFNIDFLEKHIIRSK